MKCSIDGRQVHKTGQTLRAVIPSSLAEVEDVCRSVRQLLEYNGMKDHAFGVELLVRELVNNAILHGNKLDVSKNVRISVRIWHRIIALSVADEGPGFDWRSQLCHQPDLSDTSGRGLAIGLIYADRMAFNHAGNRVVLVIRN